MINKFKFQRIAFVIFLLLLLASCSEVGLLSEDNSWLVGHISGVGDFFKVYIVLQISILIVGLLIGLFLHKLGHIISLILHFIWIISARDYGFLNVLLLFSIFSIISFLFNLILINKRKDTY